MNDKKNGIFLESVKSSKSLTLDDLKNNIELFSKRCGKITMMHDYQKRTIEMMEDENVRVMMVSPRSRLPLLGTPIHIDIREPERNPYESRVFNHLMYGQKFIDTRRVITIDNVIWDECSKISPEFLEKTRKQLAEQIDKKFMKLLSTGSPCRKPRKNKNTLSLKQFLRKCK